MLKAIVSEVKYFSYFKVKRSFANDGELVVSLCAWMQLI